MSVQRFVGDHVYVHHGTEEGGPDDPHTHYVEVGHVSNAEAVIRELADKLELNKIPEPGYIKLSPEEWSELIEIVSMIKFSVATDGGTRMTEAYG